MRVRTCIGHLDERLNLIAEPQQKEGGFSLATTVSIAVHVLLLILFVRAHRSAPEATKQTPMLRYVELMRANPQEFVEAPGPAVDRAPLTAPYSDANRRASIPVPTGDAATKRPGDGSDFYRPPMGSGGRSARPSPEPAQPGRQIAEASQQMESSAVESGASEGSTRIPALRTDASALGPVNWLSAIREVGKVASMAGPEGIDLSGIAGGEKGFAEAGPLSFETQWYDWGAYAQSMVSRIRVNWYGNMPQLIRTGMSGVVTIRFTIQRNGQITDVEMLAGSTIPPYDFAARKAIELSSPLNPLPADFPKPSERVTAMFYYNSKPPGR